jgi:ferritin-like protein
LIRDDANRFERRVGRRQLDLSREGTDGAWVRASINAAGGRVRVVFCRMPADNRSWRVQRASRLLREPDNRRYRMANEGYHEPTEELSDETRDMHRAIISLMEELEAVDWYNQRVDACKDEDLKAILAHNRDEEKEHAAMVLEWIRRKDATFDKELKDYLFTEKQIAHH